jgi:myo-inositol-1(or 4)-monophosphatase
MELERELAVVKEAVNAAAAAIMKIAREGFETAYKIDRSHLTAADLEANRIIREAVTRAFPDDGWLSEETRDDRSRLDRERVWIVDPMDGTREFTMGIPEFVISVALAERGEPVLGVIQNPSTGDGYECARGSGTRLNGTPVFADHVLGDRPVVEASRSDIEKGRFAAFASAVEIRPYGSIAHKLARLAAGKADSVFSLTPKNEWDIAAGVILVEEAGGVAVRRSGEPFRFNQPDTLVDGIVAATAGSYGPIRSIIASVAERGSS